MKQWLLLLAPNRFGVQPLKETIMNKREELLNEIEEAPEPLLSEVLDFVHFLKTKTLREKLDITVMSESSLGKDWLNPQEDEAWQNL